MKNFRIPLFVACFISLAVSASWASSESCLKACQQALATLPAEEQKTRAHQCQSGCLSVSEAKGGLAIEMLQSGSRSTHNALQAYKTLQTKEKIKQ